MDMERREAGKVSTRWETAVGLKRKGAAMSLWASAGGKISPDEPASAMRGIPIREIGEPLVDLLTPGSRLFWVSRHPVFAYERFRLLRSGAAKRLAQAAEALPAGLRLAVVEGWRHPEIQRQMHAATRVRFQTQHPEWTPRQISRAANRFSAPMERRVPPPHTTGGAVDVHLVDETGAQLDFYSPYAMLDGKSAPAFAAGLSAEAERNRATLREAMLSSGFTNYPAEWWHWSYGDQAWAYRGGHPEALYGAIEPADLVDANHSFQLHETPGF